MEKIADGAAGKQIAYGPAVRIVQVISEHAGRMTKGAVKCFFEVLVTREFAFGESPGGVFDKTVHLVVAHATTNVLEHLKGELAQEGPGRNSCHSNGMV